MDQYEVLLNVQKEWLENQGTISIKKRIEILNRLKSGIKTHEPEIIEALNLDLGKSEFEAYTTEIGFAYDSIKTTISSLKKWAKPKIVKTSVAQMPGKSMIYRAAYGSVLIIGPFNYPFQLVIEPLIGAIAGGNTVIIKPSEFAPHTERILVKLLREMFADDYIAVVTGDYTVNSALLDLPFDYIFFTGSVRVGKIVMEKASQYLTPITLELGGKSPVIIDETANLQIAANRVAWGKFSNAGQTCVAPDYALVHEKVYDSFVDHLKSTIQSFYGSDIKNSCDFGRIVSEHHMNRLVQILEQDQAKIIFGGETDAKIRYIAPTLLTDVTLEDKVMEDELFGPILPLIKYETYEDIQHHLKAHSKPLALYVFSENKLFSEKIITNFSFGGGCVNDTITHVASTALPFGGVGPSGMGHYHGKYSFETFTYPKSIVKRSTKLNLSLVFPPYKDKVKLIRKVMK